MPSRPPPRQLPWVLWGSNDWLGQRVFSRKENVIAKAVQKPHFATSHWRHTYLSSSPSICCCCCCCHGQAQVKEAPTRWHLHFVGPTGTTVQEEDKLLHFFSFGVHRYLHSRGLHNGLVLCTTAAKPRPTDSVVHDNGEEDHQAPAGDAHDGRTGNKSANFSHACFLLGWSVNCKILIILT